MCYSRHCVCVLLPNSFPSIHSLSALSIVIALIKRKQSRLTIVTVRENINVVVHAIGIFSKNTEGDANADCTGVHVVLFENQRRPV